MKATNLIIFITPVKGEEIYVEKICTVKQATALAKKEARAMLHNGGLFVQINIQQRGKYGVDTIVHIEAEKEGHKAVFSDEKPVEKYEVCWGEKHEEEDGANILRHLRETMGPADLNEFGAITLVPAEIYAK